MARRASAALTLVGGATRVCDLKRWVYPFSSATMQTAWAQNYLGSAHHGAPTLSCFHRVRAKMGRGWHDAPFDSLPTRV